jgi:CRISPR-associated exonuclease Cas4
VILASDLNRFIYCPRQVYLANVLGLEGVQTLEMGRGLVGHAVRRELSMRHRRLLERMRSAEDLDGLLRRELDAVLADIPFIFAEKWSAGYGMFIPELKEEMLSEAKRLGDELSAMAEEMGFERALEYVTPWKTEYAIASEKLGLRGRIDKLMKAPGFVPVEIKTGAVSELSWEGDRVQLCAYGMLLEDKFGKRVSHGFIEYTRVQERRPVLFTEKLRRQVIHIRDEVEEISAGKVPTVCPHGQPKKCESCSLSRICYLV